MECAGKGLGTECTGPPTRRCARCQAVAYCSLSHQISHWRTHKEECERFEEQMEQIDFLNDFPFTFTEEVTIQVTENQETRCSFLRKRGVHKTGMWSYECFCDESDMSYDSLRVDNAWHLPHTLCPCTEPMCMISKHLTSWREYYDWRSIPLHSPVAFLLHWPLTIYYAAQVAGSGGWISGINGKLHIHYLGPEKELLQFSVFSELHALFPNMDVHIELIGPSIPLHRDGERIGLCEYTHCLDRDCVCKSSSESGNRDVHSNRAPAVTLQLRRGFYHERYTDIAEESSPHLIIAPNAGIAAYSSWSPTIELIRDMNIPAVFSDYCEEACHLGARCISSVTNCPLNIPIQLNPFRQPMVQENNALFIPCYSNCFLYGMSNWSA